MKSIQYRGCTVHCTLYSLQYTGCTAYSIQVVQYTVNGLYSIQYLQLTVYRLYSINYTGCTVYRLFIVQCSYMNNLFKFMSLLLAITFSGALSISLASTTLPRLDRNGEKKDCPNDLTNHPFNGYKLTSKLKKVHFFMTFTSN